MNNALDSLREILLSPAHPIDTDCEYWEYHQSVLQLSLPTDYWDFALVYGSISVETKGTFHEIVSPFRPTYPIYVLSQSRVWNIIRAESETDLPFGIFPEEDGVLPFGKTSEGGLLGWITRGEPDTWPVIDIMDFDDERGHEVFDNSFTEYLHGLLSCKRLPKRISHFPKWPSSSIKCQAVFKGDYGNFKPPTNP